MRITNPDLFGWPAARRFFGPDETAGGGGGTGTETPPASSGSLADFSPASETPPAKPSASEAPVEGEVAPNFGALGKKSTPTPTPKPAEGKETTPKPSEAPKTPTPTPEPKKTPAEPPKGSQPPAKTPEPAKPKETPPAKTPEAKPISAQPTKKEEPKPGEYKAPELPKDDSDIDGLQPKPGAPAHVIRSFNDMKALMKQERTQLREALAENQRLQTEFETVKKGAGEIPEEVQKELEGLRNFNLLFRAEQDPRFKAEFDKPIEDAETKLYDMLKGMGLKDDILKEIKDAAEAAGGDPEAWKRWGELFDFLKNPLSKRKIEDAIMARTTAVSAKQQRLSQLAGSRDKFFEEVGKRDEQERTQFAQAAEQASIPFAAANDWIRPQEIPADATPEQKAAIEAHNKDAQARAEAWGGYVRAAYGRDAEKTAEMAFNAVKAEYLEGQNEELNKKLETSKARVTELEKQLAKIRSAGRIAHTEAPPADTKAPKEGVTDGQVGGDGSSAIRTFFTKKAGA